VSATSTIHRGNTRSRQRGGIAIIVALSLVLLWARQKAKWS